MNRLKTVREEKGYTQKEISNFLGVDQSNYSKYELEKICVPVSIVKKLAVFYRTSTDYLLYMTDKKKPYPISEFYHEMVPQRTPRKRQNKKELENISQ